MLSLWSSRRRQVRRSGMLDDGRSKCDWSLPLLSEITLLPNYDAWDLSFAGEVENLIVDY